MPFTKGVVHFSHDGRQTVVLTMAIPKTHRLKGVTQHSGKGLKPNFTIGIQNVFLGQHVF